MGRPLLLPLRDILMSKDPRKPFLIRIRDREREAIQALADHEDISESEVARRLLVPMIALAVRFGLNEVAAELRHQAEAAGLSRATLKRRMARAKAKLPLKGSGAARQSPRMRFG